MLVFIIPLKSKEVSNSWATTCQLLERCLRSVCNQTDSSFKVVVVCNQKPAIKWNHPNIHYLEVDLDIPGSRKEKELDKGRKIIQGLIYSRKFSPCHVMFVDADDCLSRHLVKYVNENHDSNGWFLNDGYVYQENSALIYYRKSHFYSWCGTCNILKMDLCPLPEKEESLDEELNYYYSGMNHRNLKDDMKSKGYPLMSLPFTGAVYIVGNGENIYQKGFSTIHNANRGRILFFLKELLKNRLLTSSIREEFSLYKLK